MGGPNAISHLSFSHRAGLASPSRDVGADPVRDVTPDGMHDRPLGEHLQDMRRLGVQFPLVKGLCNCPHRRKRRQIDPASFPYEPKLYIPPAGERLEILNSMPGKSRAKRLFSGRHRDNLFLLILSVGRSKNARVIGPMLDCTWRARAPSALFQKELSLTVVGGNPLPTSIRILSGTVIA